MTGSELPSRTLSRHATAITLALTSTLFSAQSGLAQSSSAPPPVIGRFAGTWQENQSKHKIGSGLANLRFRRAASGGLEELRGPEIRPVAQPVNFDGKPYTIDGGNVIVWKQLDPAKFERQIFDGRTSPAKTGQLITTRRIQISADGKTLTEETERVLTDGKKSVATVVWGRTSGESQGLAGIWKPQSIRDSPPPRETWDRAGTNGLKFSDDAGRTYTFLLDSKPVPVSGPAVMSATTVAAKQVDDHTIELTQSREGVVTGTTKITISPDGKSMTYTIMTVAPGAGREPTIEVYEKQ